MLRTVSRMSLIQPELRAETSGRVSLSPCHSISPSCRPVSPSCHPVSPSGQPVSPSCHPVSPCGPGLSPSRVTLSPSGAGLSPARVSPGGPDIDCESRGSGPSDTCSPAPLSPPHPGGRANSALRSNFCIEEILKPNFGRAPMCKDSSVDASAFAPWNTCASKGLAQARRPSHGLDLMLPQGLATLGFPYDLTASHRAALSFMAAPWAPRHDANPAVSPTPRRPQPYLPRPSVPHNDCSKPSPPASPRPASPQPTPPRARPCPRPAKRSAPEEDEGETQEDGSVLWPAWVYCTRYSDRPSSGPRSRKVRRQEKKVEEKRPRTAFTSDQLAQLRREFEENRYLTEERRHRLAAELNLNESQIKIWFQNKRAKIKKSTGQGRNGLALQLMAQGLYNHSTVPMNTSDDEDE